MKTFFTITILLTAIFCKGQSNNLIPLDSAYFETTCPCVLSEVHGVILYHSGSAFKKYNRCLFLYKSNNEYFILMGQMMNDKNEAGEFIWKLSGDKLESKVAEKYISMVRQEIIKARVSEYDQLVIVDDGATHTFGDIENNNYAITPRAYYSESVDALIEMSEKFIKIKNEFKVRRSRN